MLKFLFSALKDSAFAMVLLLMNNLEYHCKLSNGYHQRANFLK